MNKPRLMLTAMFIAAAGTVAALDARAEFKAELKSEVDAKNVTQIGIVVKGGTVQNNVGGIATNGIKDANIKLNTKVKTGSVTQVGIAAYGSQMQSNLGSVSINAK